MCLGTLLCRERAAGVPRGFEMYAHTKRSFILLVGFEKIIGNLIYNDNLLYNNIKMTSEFFCFAWFVQGSNVLKKIVSQARYRIFRGISLSGR